MPDCRIGFVGAGGVAARHARMLIDIAGVRLVAVTDPIPHRAEQFANTFGANTASGIPQLLSAGLDAVYVCVPPASHGPIEEAVVSAGLAMFVEKPLGTDEATAERVAAAVRRAGTITAVGHHWRYSETVDEAARLLVGRQVRLVLGSWLDRVPSVPWWTRQRLSGGQVIEQAVHVLDLARLLAGEVTQVCAMAGGRLPDPEADIDAATAAVLRFANGAIGTLAATCVLDGKRRAGLEVYADGLELTVMEDGVLVHGPRDFERHRPVDPDVAKRAADVAFVDAVRGRGNDIRVTYDEALRTHQLACRVAMSVATHEREHDRAGT
jgi:myo-inositol 2-dehydrogenase / D-chiro-inositol 1-dehydrogenase